MSAQLFSAPIIPMHSFVFLDLRLPPKLQPRVTVPHEQSVLFALNKMTWLPRQ